MPNKSDSWTATGRRKSSIARVSMSTGKGSFIVNNREIKIFFDNGQKSSKKTKTRLWQFQYLIVKISMEIEKPQNKYKN